MALVLVPARRRAVVVVGVLAVLLGSGCGLGRTSVQVGATTTTAPVDPAADTAGGAASGGEDDGAPDDGTGPSPDGSGGPGPVVGSGVVAGWVAYEVLEGWEVTTEVTGLRPWVEGADSPAYDVRVDDLEVLLNLERTDGTARVTLAREPRFLFVEDVDAWSGSVASAIAGPGERVVDDRRIDLPHGSARRLVLEGEDTTRIVATTAFGEQRLLIEGLTGLSPDAVAEVGRVLEGVVLDPAVTVTPLLHRLPGIVTHEDDAGRAVARLTFDVPADWRPAGPGGAGFSAPDGAARIDVGFPDRVGRSIEDGLRAVLDEPVPGRDAVASAEVRAVGGRRMAVARHAPAALEEVDLATTWTVVGEAGDRFVQVTITTERGVDDAPVLRAILDSLELRTP